MIFLQALCLYLFGFGIVNLLAGGSEEGIFIKLGSAPFLTLLFFNFVFIIFNSLGIPISQITILPIFYSGAALSLFFYSKEIREILRGFKSFITLSKVDAVLGVFSVLLLMGVLLSSYSRELWPGDGMGIWSTRALEWRTHQSLVLTEFTTKTLSYWLGYPIFHSLNLLFSSILFSVPFAYSVNALDFIPYVSVVFLAQHFFRHFNLNLRISTILSVLVAFGHRNFLNMIGSAYADPTIAYLSALIFVALTTFDCAKKRNHFKLLLVSLFYCALIKNEGVYRSLILVIPGIIIFLQELRIAKKVTLLLAPGLGVICAKVFNSSATAIVPYVDEMSLTLDVIVARIPIVFDGFAYMIWDLRYGFFKSSWAPVCLVLISSLILNLNSTLSGSLKLRKITIFVIVFIFANSVFNFAPLLLTNLEGEVFNLPEMIGGDILQRLFYQSLFPVMMFIYLSLTFYRQSCPTWSGGKK